MLPQSLFGGVPGYLLRYRLVQRCLSEVVRSIDGRAVFQQRPRLVYFCLLCSLVQWRQAVVTPRIDFRAEFPE